MKRLTVYNYDNKIRLGKDYAGGYVIADIPDYDMYICGGVGNDGSFDEDVINTFDIKIAFLFDGTHFNKLDCVAGHDIIKKNIGPEETEKATNLKELLSKAENAFLSIDIEGHEYDWLDCLSDELKNVKQFVIEFHNAEKTLKAAEKINETHYLVHVHGNNCGGSSKIGDRMIPDCIECTYIRKDLLHKVELSRQPIPGALDMRCCKNMNEVKMNYKPFVH